ncbi:hypothetical protein I551_1859 [Mycobacterium ulcerans str. Harvey]|uniref:Uncharacterized protein n=1 Tax=Mycobacterium ulcerans str. Harvey TaxID=1299332 RepID=A0ABN0R3E5_MYCUL|nr:hypothetical protein I551_1859 [Mycobacterium ulcerans str. Harvey]
MAAKAPNSAFPPNPPSSSTPLLQPLTVVAAPPLPGYWLSAPSLVPQPAGLPAREWLCSN